MNILFVTQYFYPEEFRGNDIVFDWIKRGNNVTVLTAIPNYPSGKTYKGYGFFKKRKEMVNGVNVIRVPVITRGNASGIRLMLNYLSFVISGSSYGFYLALTKKYDCVFVQQLSPVTIALPGIVVKKIKKIPLYLWVLDLWPESLTSAGDINNKFILIFFEKIVRFIYHNSEKILISSKGFKYSICKKGDFENKILYFPNWAEDIYTQKLNYSIPPLPDGFIIMFAGNIGEAQNFETVLEISKKLKYNKEIKFVFLGDGRKKRWVEEFILREKLHETVFCLGRFPLKLMPAFFEKADVMLASLKDEEIFNLTLPAKVQAYMMSKKPIIGLMNGEGMELINESKCGYCVSPSNIDGFIECVTMMKNMNKNELQQLGENGFDFAMRYFNKVTIMDKFHRLIVSSR